MRKFLPILLAALIVFAAGSPSADAENIHVTGEDFRVIDEIFGIDVPDFRNVAGNNVRFIGSSNNSRGYMTYSYECNLELDERENFAESFVRLLRDYQFVLVANDTGNHIKSSAMFTEYWRFDYTGSKNVARVNFTTAGKISPRAKNYGHIAVMRHQHFMDGRTKIFVQIANGLTYGGGN